MQATCPLSMPRAVLFQGGALHQGASCLKTCNREWQQDSVVEGGWPPSLHPSQPASCLLLDIPQLGSVPWAQPLLSCPPTRCRCRHSSGIWVMPDASVSPLGRSWKTPTRCPEMGGGVRCRESIAEWQLPGMDLPFFTGSKAWCCSPPGHWAGQSQAGLPPSDRG